MSRDLTLLAIGAHEQAICHRLAVYLEYWFSTYEIDCEYNRMESKIKRVLLDDNTSIWFGTYLRSLDFTYHDVELVGADEKLRTDLTERLAATASS